MAVMMSGKSIPAKLKNSKRQDSLTGIPLDPLEKKLYMVMSEYRNVLENQNVVVAVSGGIDSVILLNALVKLTGRLKYKIFVAHINHGVRAKDADGDEAFVIEMANRLGVPVITKKFKIPKLKVSENALRERRYEILFDVKHQMGASVIITAHHRDDLIETRLMRLLHGTGIHGLKAMTIISPEGLLRPFLTLTRRDIEIYAKKLGLRWRNDATNSDTTKFRNWIRRNWIARLRMDHPGYVDSLFESLERLVKATEGLTVKQGSANTKIKVTTPAAGAGKVSVTVLDREALKKLSDHEQDEEIYAFLRQNTSTRVTSSHVKEFKKRLQTPRKSFGFRVATQDWSVENYFVHRKS